MRIASARQRKVSKVRKIASCLKIYVYTVTVALTHILYLNSQSFYDTSFEPTRLKTVYHIVASSNARY